MFDVAVIGAGPGGYACALSLAKRGMKVASIEREEMLGGTCLRVGCIPSKALLYSSELYHKVQKEGASHGIVTSSLGIDLNQMMTRKEKVVMGLGQGIDFLYRKYKVTRFKGSAKVTSPQTIVVGAETIEAKKIILATGSEPISLPFLPFDETKVLSSTGALSLKGIPKTMLVIGAGVIGLELGSVYQRLGTKVTFVELLDRVCPPFDREISQHLDKIFKKQGMEFHLSTKVTGGAVGNDVTLQLEGGKELTAECVLVAIGRKASSKHLGLEEIGIATDSQGRVTVNASFQTNIPSIYAIGDLIDGPMLAHKASEEALAVADILSGETAHVNYLAIPNVMYTAPEVAAVGMTEEEAKNAGLELVIGRFPMMGNSRARATGEAEGFVKVIGEKTTCRLIGMHIIAASASEMIGEGVIAIEKKMTLQELAAASHAHPTYTEAIKEACLQSLNKIYHL